MDTTQSTGTQRARGARIEEADAARAAVEGTRAERLRIGAQALRGLLRDPDDTRQVFLLGLVANGGRFQQFYERIAASAEGAALLREQPSIDSTTVDFAAMRALPAGTLGGAYARYLDDNGLDPDLFQAPPGLPPTVAFVVKRVRQTHDIWHVLTGYRPDVPGEVALQAFTFGQTRMPSAALIAVLGTLRHVAHDRRLVPRVIDGYRRGRRAKFLPAVRWEALWERPLSEVRALVGVTPARA